MWPENQGAAPEKRGLGTSPEWRRNTYAGHFPRAGPSGPSPGLFQAPANSNLHPGNFLRLLFRLVRLITAHTCNNKSKFAHNFPFFPEFSLLSFLFTGVSIYHLQTVVPRCGSRARG